MELNEYEWEHDQENFVKFSGVVDRRHGLIPHNSGAPMLHVIGAKGVFFFNCECADIDRASGLLMWPVSITVNKVLQSFIDMLNLWD